MRHVVVANRRFVSRGAGGHRDFYLHGPMAQEWAAGGRLGDGIGLDRSSAEGFFLRGPKKVLRGAVFSAGGISESLCGGGELQWRTDAEAVPRIVAAAELSGI